MSDRVEFKGTVIRKIYYIICTNVVVGIGLLVSRTRLRLDVVLILAGVVNISYLASIISKPFKIIVDRSNFVVEFHYLFRVVNKVKVVRLDELSCTFQLETRARGGKVDVLKIMQKNEVIVELLPEYNGWSRNSLNDVFQILNNFKKVN